MLFYSTLMIAMRRQFKSIEVDTPCNLQHFGSSCDVSFLISSDHWFRSTSTRSPGAPQVGILHKKRAGVRTMPRACLAIAPAQMLAHALHLKSRWVLLSTSAHTDIQALVCRHVKRSRRCHQCPLSLLRALQRLLQPGPTLLNRPHQIKLRVIEQKLS